MKQTTFYLAALVFTFFSLLSGCTTTPEESCEQDEICSGKMVTACCTTTECYYEYNGVKYGDDDASMAQLAAALGCTSAMADTYQDDLDRLILRLQSLSEIAQAGLTSDK